MISLFQQKGFSVEDLVSLVGAHSAGVNRNGTAFDTTVHSLDSPTFYRETAAGTAPTSLFSDRSLANDSASKADWTEYAENQGLWDEHFATAYVWFSSSLLLSLHVKFWNKLGIQTNFKCSPQQQNAKDGCPRRQQPRQLG